ncbi:MAG: ATP-binding region ATPase domain protein [Geminicoccaceae bacterium]|nr:ATP-binding region ATPase domain protein [Geminicoccaceae bacterium]
MTHASPSVRPVPPAGQALIPSALVVLVGLVAWLTYGARAAERSHRATAESALRDYAAFASWEFARHTQGLLTSRVHGSLGRARDLRLASGADLPPATLVDPEAAHCGCGFGEDTRFAFRFDLGQGTLETSRVMPAPVQAAIGRLAPAFHAAVHDGLGRRTRRSEPLDAWARLVVETLDGRESVVAYTIVHDAGGRARAAYGVVAQVEGLTKLFDCAMTKQALLPPSLVGSAPNDSVLGLRVATPSGVTIYERGGGVGSALAAADTMPVWAGGLVTTVALRSETAESLLIGGMPASRLPTYLALLAAAVLVAVLALVQLRRGRELALLRSQFIANVSHELRTPLAQISMFSETLMLDRERSPDERRHFLSVILREARRLTHLVEGVLRFSRGEGAADAARPEPRDITSDIADTVASFQPLATAAEATLVLDAAGSVHAWADAGAVRQIVLNLLDNAMKYGSPGQTVVVGVLDDEREVTVFVEDEGVGIPVADRHRVFEAFARLERPGAPRVSGSGIGLSVVRDLVAAHGGRVWVGTGRNNRGTRVSFTLATAPCAASDLAPPDDRRDVAVARTVGLQGAGP